MQVRLAVVQLDAVPRKLDRRREQVAPRQLAERLLRGLETDYGAGHSTRGGADVEDLRRAAAEVHVHPIHLRELTHLQPEPGDGDEEIEDAGRAVARAMDQHEAARTGT